MAQFEPIKCGQMGIVGKKILDFADVIKVSTPPTLATHFSEIEL